jgi:fructokinase
VTILKVNHDEAGTIAEGVFGKCMARGELFAALRSKYKLALLVCTLGGDGCEVFGENGSHKCAAEPVKVTSAVGAGDAFSAAFLASRVRGLDVETAARNANILAGAVASSHETVPEYASEVVEKLAGLR